LEQFLAVVSFLLYQKVLEDKIIEVPIEKIVERVVEIPEVKQVQRVVEDIIEIKKLVYEDVIQEVEVEEIIEIEKVIEVPQVHKRLIQRPKPGI